MHLCFVLLFLAQESSVPWAPYALCPLCPWPPVPCLPLNATRLVANAPVPFAAQMLFFLPYSCFVLLVQDKEAHAHEALQMYLFVYMSSFSQCSRA